MNCAFYTTPENLRGKQTICHGCGEGFELKGFISELPKKPRCSKCKYKKLSGAAKAMVDKKKIALTSNAADEFFDLLEEDEDEV